MSNMIRFGRAFHLLAMDFKMRNAKQLRELLPARETKSALRYIRACACKSQKPDLICPKWPQPDPLPNEDDNIPVFSLEDNPRNIWNSDYKCSMAYCKKPVLSINDFLKELRIIEVDKKFDERKWRGYAHEGNRMPTKLYSYILISAFRNGWLADLELRSRIEEKNNMLIVVRSVANFIDRIMERKDFEPFKKIHSIKSFLVLLLLKMPNLFGRDFEKELQKQSRLIDAEEIKIFDRHLKNENTPKPMKEMIKYAISVHLEKYTVKEKKPADHSTSKDKYQ